MLGLDRITFDPNVMGGRACIRGMRITVSLIVNLVANGKSMEEIIKRIHTWSWTISVRHYNTLHGLQKNLSTP